MLRRLRLNNWQCHQDLQIDLDKITVLVGGNDIGKTAILRALVFLAFNQWNGAANSHVTWGEEFSEIELAFDDNVVIRRKGKSVNDYVLNNIVYNAFGAGKVPGPVVNALNLGMDNVQQQHDPAFWLTLTAGQAASALNEIFNLSSIDNALGMVGTELRLAKTTEALIQERLDDAQRTKKELDWVVKANEDLKELEALEADLADNSRRIQSLIDQIETLERSLLETKRLAGVIDLAENALIVGQQCLDVGNRIAALISLQNKQSEIAVMEKDLKIKEKKLAGWLKETCPLCGRGN